MLLKIDLCRNASVLQLEIHSSSSKYQIASMITEVAQDYKFIMLDPQVRETVEANGKGNNYN